MNKLALVGAVAGLGLAALLAAPRGHADRPRAPTLAPSPMADINDLYAWMEGSKLNLAMSISPVDSDTRTFGPGVQYVFHVHSKEGIGVGVDGTGAETRVICTFESNTSAQCWVADAASGAVKDYVTGDPSVTTGLASGSGRVRVFAGKRSDPLFFNLQGYRAATGALRAALPTITTNVAGCPNNVSDNQIQTIAANFNAAIQNATPPCPANQRDCFANLNVKIVLVQLDRALVNAGPNTAVGVWASTNTGS